MAGPLSPLTSRSSLSSLTSRSLLPLSASLLRVPSCPAGTAGTAPAVRIRAVLGLLLLSLLLVGPPAEVARAEGARWQWPLAPPHTVVATFDAPEHRYGPGHRGIDIAVAREDAEVRAVEAGTIRFSGMVAGRGVVSVTHADGLISTYEPVLGLLEPGVQVEAGELLGTISGGAEVSHCAGAACLHLGARRGEDYIDPLLLLRARGPSVLLPWSGGTGMADRPGPGGTALRGGAADGDGALRLLPDARSGGRSATTQ